MSTFNINYELSNYNDLIKNSKMICMKLLKSKVQKTITKQGSRQTQNCVFEIHLITINTVTKVVIEANKTGI